MEVSALLKSKISDLPEKSGVYIMRDSSGHIIYIGKAVVLKNRVKQYFSSSAKEPKVEAMVNAIADFDYMITLTEKDALSLEANLIRKHKPKYNILLKDDKHSPYIRIDLTQKFPTIEITRKVKNDGAKYFGPYFYGVRVGDIVAIISQAYKMRACPKGFYSTKRECLNYHIGLCYGPCCNNISQKEYKEVVQKVIAFLSGKEDTAEKLINARMADCVKQEDFERAIKYRDTLEMIKKLKLRTLDNLNSSHNIDAISVSTGSTLGAISVAIVRCGKLMGIRNYAVTGAFNGQIEALEQFLVQYYSNSNADIPQEICFDSDNNFDGLEQYLSSITSKKVIFTNPKIGVKKKLVDMAQENSSDYLIKSVATEKRDYEMTQGAVDTLSQILGVANIRRMECYDISNISGVDKVASGVVFIDGKSAKSEYRKYKIKTVKGADDFASMSEVLTRRLSRGIDGDNSFTDFPDLIVVDGGKGQLSSAKAVLDKLGVDIPLISLAKREEEIFTLNSNQPIILRKDSFALKLLQRIRDEAHRFAITYHRNLRSKRYHSELDDIPYVGEIKRKILLKTFSNVKDIALCSVAELSAIKGIDTRTAQSVFDYYNKKS